MGRDIFHCECISLNFLKLTEWRPYHFRLAGWCGTWNFRPSLSPLPASKDVPCQRPSHRRLGHLGPWELPRTLNLASGEKKTNDFYVLNHCSKMSSSESFIWALKSNLRETSQYVRPPWSPQNLHLRKQSFPQGSSRLCESGRTSFQASLPSRTAHPTPTSRPPIVLSQLSLRADPELPIGKPSRHSAHTLGPDAALPIPSLKRSKAGPSR